MINNWYDKSSSLRVGWLVDRDLGGSWDLLRASAEKQPALRIKLPMNCHMPLVVYLQILFEKFLVFRVTDKRFLQKKSRIFANAHSHYFFSNKIFNIIEMLDRVSQNVIIFTFLMHNVSQVIHLVHFGMVWVWTLTDIRCTACHMGTGIFQNGWQRKYKDACGECFIRLLPI